MAVVMTRKLAALYEAHACNLLTQKKNEEKEIMQEIRNETHNFKKIIVKEKLDEYRDNSADAIADYYKLSRQIARGLCRNMRRGTLQTHRGNDYDFR